MPRPAIERPQRVARVVKRRLFRVEGGAMVGRVIGG